MTVDPGFLNRLRSRGEEVLTQVSAELSSNPRFMQAMAGALRGKEKLGSIFGVYGEWGQPIHDVGNDVRLLGLSIRRPETAAGFRMLCRHNKYVQEFAKVRDADEIARRERVWETAIDEIEYETGRQVAAIRAREFRQLLADKVELASFKPR